MTETEALSEGKLLTLLINEYREQQVDSWLACDDWEKRNDFHAKVNAAKDIEQFIRNKAAEYGNG